MNKEEAITLLKSGQKGVEEWNLRRKGPEDIPSLGEVDLHGQILRGVNFDNIDLQRSNLSGADLREATFASADLRGTKFKQARLHAADFNGADLRGASFYLASLGAADRRFAKVDFETNFEGADVRDWKIDKYTLMCLGEEYGHLTTGQRMDMHIVDGLATLRSTYSGFLLWVHLARTFHDLL